MGMPAGGCVPTYVPVRVTHTCVRRRAGVRVPARVCAQACAPAGVCSCVCVRRCRACADTSAWVATGTHGCAQVCQRHAGACTRVQTAVGLPLPIPIPAPTTTTTTSAVPAAKNIPHGCLQPSPRQREDGERGLGGWGVAAPPPRSIPPICRHGNPAWLQERGEPPRGAGVPGGATMGWGLQGGGWGGRCPPSLPALFGAGGGAPRPLNPPVNHSWGRGAANPPAPGPGLGGRAAAQPARGPGSRGGDTHGPYS